MEYVRQRGRREGSNRGCSPDYVCLARRAVVDAAGMLCAPAAGRTARVVCTRRGSIPDVYCISRNEDYHCMES